MPGREGAWRGQPHPVRGGAGFGQSSAWQAGPWGGPQTPLRGRFNSDQRMDGGPWLNGSPATVVAQFAGTSTKATCGPGQLGMKLKGNCGSGSQAVQHKSQCMLACCAAPCTGSAWRSAPALALQTPPNAPVRASSASMETGAHKADTTANTPRQATHRDHAGRGIRERGQRVMQRL